MRLRLWFINLVVIFPLALGFQVFLRHAAKPQAAQPYQDITVKMYALTDFGGIVKGPNSVCQIDNPATTENEGDVRWGCTAFNTASYPPPQVRPFPYPANPATVSIEADYLLDVVPMEMGPSGHNPLGLRTQAIAARTYAYCAIRSSLGLVSWGNCNKEINNSNSFQVFIPYYFDTLSENEKRRVENATAQVIYLQDFSDSSKGSIFAEFSSDAYLTTAAGDYGYLKSVADPISYDPAILDIISASNAHQRGMSQNGANRWAWGNSSRLGGGTPWPVRWTDYRQILAHYYTGIDFLNGSVSTGSTTVAAKIAPDDRWNLLGYRLEDDSDVPQQITLGQEYRIKLRIQNTSTTKWSAGEISLGPPAPAPSTLPFVHTISDIRHICFAFFFFLYNFLVTSQDGIIRRDSQCREKSLAHSFIIQRLS